MSNLCVYFINTCGVILLILYEKFVQFLFLFSGDEWSTEAVDLFEELADVALWQKKIAHVVTYRESPHKRGQRAGSPVPVIELHDKVCINLK